MTQDIPTSSSPAHLRLGVCDYPEHVPKHLWADYARQQRALGLSFVRLAEFAWSRIEPAPGQYDWAWLDEAVRTVVAAGLDVVLCTPTAAPPAWLVQACPEILPVGKDGQVKAFGSRRHYDFSSPAFRAHSRRITRALAERYGTHAGVIGWQTDNEFGWGDTAQSYSPAAAVAFRAWLQEKYGALEALNAAWGTVFWSMEYSGWAQLDVPGRAVSEENPAHLLDFLRFSSAQVAAFQAEQVAILRACSPGRFVTHNFMGFFSAFDHYEVSRDLDFASWDSYPTGTLEALREWRLGPPEWALAYARTGHPDLTALNHDLYRGMGGGMGGAGRFWVMEQQCGPVNWAQANPLPPRGALELWTAQAWAHGADAVTYFRWRAATMAQEVLHSGLLKHSGQPDRGYAEVGAIDPAAYPDAPVRARVALLHDYESLWLIGMQPHAAGLTYWAQLFLYYRALRRLGVDVDIVPPDRDLGGYAAVVAPALTLMTPERAAHLTRAAQACPLVFGPRTAFRTASGNTPETGQFGNLAGLVGAALGHYDSLPEGLEQTVVAQTVTRGGQAHAAHLWAESYDLSDAEALARYAGGPLDGEAAVIRRGNVTVIGAHSETLVLDVLREVLVAAGVPVEAPLPEGVRLSRRGDVTLVQNWNDRPATWNGLHLPPISSRRLNTPPPTPAASAAQVAALPIKETV